MLLILFEKHN